MDAIEEYIEFNKSVATARTEEILLLIASDEKRGIYELTSEWRNRKKLRINISKSKCEQCNKKRKNLHVHHLNYDRYGCENWDDLQVLCVPCHKEFHNEYPHHNRHFAVTKNVSLNMDEPPQDFF